LFDLEDLKRNLLLVDKIAILHDDDWQTDWYCRERNPALAADLDWLRDRGIVERVESAVAVKSVGELTARIDFKPTVEDASGRMSAVPESLMLVLPGTVTDRGAPALVAACDLCRRVLCEQLMAKYPIHAISLGDPGASLPAWTATPPQAANVLRVIIEQFPYPDESTSLEQIPEFRSDPNNQRTLVSLRKWASNIAANATAAEVAHELQHLVGEYEHYMKIHEMKIQRGVWETVITIAAESIEHMLKIQFGQLAKSIFAISSRKVDLLEAELKAPGRDIAYVSRARKYLCSSSQ